MLISHYENSNDVDKSHLLQCSIISTCIPHFYTIQKQCFIANFNTGRHILIKAFIITSFYFLYKLLGPSSSTHSADYLTKSQRAQRFVVVLLVN